MLHRQTTAAAPTSTAKATATAKVTNTDDTERQPKGDIWKVHTVL